MKTNYQINNIEQLENLAENLLHYIKIGTVFLLKGELGTGKTTLSSLLIKKLGCEEIVTSPTFGIVHTYHTHTLEIWHFDLYRITKYEELLELGLDDALKYGFTIIEWPEIIEEKCKFTNKITIHLTLDCSNNRSAEVTI